MGGNTPFPMHAGRPRRAFIFPGQLSLEFPMDHPRAAPRPARRGASALCPQRRSSSATLTTSTSAGPTSLPTQTARSVSRTIQEHVCVQIKGVGDCKHVFGLECLQAYLGRNPESKKECPLCRQEWIPEAGVWQDDGRHGRRMMPAQHVRHPFPAQAHGQGARHDAYMFLQGHGANVFPRGHGQHAPRVVWTEEPPRRHRHRSSRHGAQQMRGQDAYEQGNPWAAGERGRRSELDIRDGPEQAALQAAFDEMMRRPPAQ